MTKRKDGRGKERKSNFSGMDMSNGCNLKVGGAVAALVAAVTVGFSGMDSRRVREKVRKETENREKK